jgi:hypothetical protein
MSATLHELDTVSAPPSEQEPPPDFLENAHPMANPEAKAAWLGLARSGKHRQAFGQMRDGAKFCILALGCEAFRITTGQGHWSTDGAFVVPGERPHFSTMPPAVVAWYGLAEGDPVLKGQHLSELNDSDAYNFFDLAALIEAHL